MSEVFFNGPVGRIEGKFFQAEDEKAPVALILHPHPVYGGTMNNKVVYTAFKAFAKSGISVLRINFRGVGKSQGEYDGGIGELTDAATALDWLQINRPLANSYWISGFSFGAWIAMQLIMRRPEINNFIALSPPVNKYDFSFLSPCPIPGLIVQGTNDSIVTEDSVINLVERLSKQKNIKVKYKSVENADHFFREKLDDLESIVMNYISEHFSPTNSSFIVKSKNSKAVFLE